jgi:NAD(P)-dependent dehydrogenase (short-subunit alcohol dehydrogenase family)
VAGVDQPTAPVAHVLVVGRNEQRASDVVAEIEHGGGSAAYRLTTLADATSARELAKWVTETGDGHVDILVNNAGTALPGPSESGTEAEFDETFTISVKVPFFLVAALAPAMAARGWGAIVNISTMVAGFGGPGMAMYGASRAALELLTRAWAAEYGPRGVRVNAVAPGPVRTPMNEGVGDIPQQVAALSATLNISGHGITAPPARQPPGPWLSVLAHYRRRKLEQALRCDGCAAAAVAFPELDGIRLALLGMHNVDGGTVLYGHASGMTLAGSRRPPGAELDFPLRIWVRDGGGRWHATRAAARGWSAEDDSDMTMRLEVVPPLSPATAWIEVLAAGQSVQARATLPASLAVAAGGYPPAWPPRRSHRADCGWLRSAQVGAAATSPQSALCRLRLDPGARSA